MRNYVIINGVNSLTIQGLAIKTLPPITKPIQRNLREEIDGRDGDIVTTLGYGAYDKTIEIGLFGTFDIDEVIAFFNQKGTITFSNEADKVYYFEALDQVDYAELLKFRTANVVLHCQPFKYPLNETPLVEEYEYVEATGTNVTLDNTSEAIFNKIDLKGNTSQDGTPTPDIPIPINVVSGDNTIDICDKNLLGLQENTYSSNGITASVSNGEITLNGTATANTFISLYTDNTINWVDSQIYTINAFNPILNSNVRIRLETSGSKDIILNPANKTAQIEYSEDLGLYTDRIQIRVQNGTTLTNFKLQPMLVKGTTAPTTYEPYTGKSYPIYLGVENLFDKDNMNVLNASVTSSVITSNVSAKMFYIPCKPNTTYTISREIVGARFVAYTTATTPTIGLSILQNVGGNTDASITITTNASANYLMVYYLYNASEDETKILSSIQVEKGSKANSFTPYGQTPIELCKIGDYQDYIYKDNGSWYLHKEIGKVVLDGSESDWFLTTETGKYSFWFRNNTIGALTQKHKKYCDLFTYTSDAYTIVGTPYLCENSATSNPTNFMFIFNTDGTQGTTLANWKKWLSSHNTNLYYVLANSTNTEITDTTLLEQLEDIKNANSYEGQTNISQDNNDLPFILDLSALKENSDHLVIDNIGNIYSKPTLDLEGTGIVDIYLNDTQMFEVDLSEKNEIVIDTEKMEAYNPTDNTLANRQVTGDYSKFKLDSGENDLRFSGDLTKATITNYERWL